MFKNKIGIQMKKWLWFHLPEWLMLFLGMRGCCIIFTAWKVSKCRVISGPYFPVFGLNTEIYAVNLSIHSENRKFRTEITPHLDSFHGVINKAEGDESLPFLAFPRNAVNAFFENIQIKADRSRAMQELKMSHQMSIKSWYITRCHLKNKVGVRCVKITPDTAP